MMADRSELDEVLSNGERGVAHDVRMTKGVWHMNMGMAREDRGEVCGP